MDLKTAKEITHKCGLHVFYLQGVTEDEPPSLAEYTLSELLEANHRVKQWNARDPDEAGRKNMQIYCDDRLIAALYVTYQYEPDWPDDAQPIAMREGCVLLLLRAEEC
jgi:hypothetical protein